MLCMQCGAELPDNAKFCPVCGVKITYGNSETEKLEKSVTENKPSEEITESTSEKIVLELGKRKLEFPATMKQYAQHHQRYVKSSNNICEDFIQEYSKLRVETVEDVLGSVSNLLAKECAIITKTSFTRLLVLNIRNYSFELYLEYVLHFYNPEDAFKPFSDKADEVAAKAQRLASYRAVQRASRGKWVGGGFGLKGAIEGAATAGALNMAGNVFHGITDSVTNISDKAKLRKMLVVDAQQVAEYFEEVLRNYAFAAYRAETITLVQYGYLEEYSWDTSKADTRLKNAKAVIQLYADQGVEKLVMAMYDGLNAAIDCIQLNPFNISYYEDIYDYGIVVKTASSEYSKIIRDLFEFAKFFEMEEECGEYIKSRSENFYKPYLKRIQEHPKDAEEIYQEFLTAAEKVQEDNPFFNTQALVGYVNPVKCRVVEKYNESITRKNEKESFKNDYIKYYDWLLKGKIKELWDIANRNDPIVQYILLRYYNEEVLGDAITDVEIDNCKSEKCILKEVEALGGSNDFAEFLKNLLLETRNHRYPEIAERYEEKMVSLAEKTYPCISAVAYAGIVNMSRGDPKVGVKYLEAAAKEFSPLAMAGYANYLLSRKKGEQTDKEEAYYYLEAAVFVGQRNALELKEKYKLGYAVYYPMDKKGKRLHAKTDEVCFCDRGRGIELTRFPKTIVNRYYSRLLCEPKCICINYGKELTKEQHVTEVKKSLLIPEDEKIYFAVSANVMGTSKKDMSGLAIGTRGVYIRETGIIKKRFFFSWNDFKKIQVHNNSGLHIGNYLVMVSVTIEKTMLHLMQDLQSLCENYLEVAYLLEESSDENMLDEELARGTDADTDYLISNPTEKSPKRNMTVNESQPVEEDYEDMDENELDKAMLEVNNLKTTEAAQQTAESVMPKTAVGIETEFEETREICAQAAGLEQEKKEKCCPVCQKANKLTAKFCVGCGYAFSEERICKECGNKIRPGKKFCSACGAKVED